jgi:hypothetical protein
MFGIDDAILGSVLGGVASGAASGLTGRNKAQAIQTPQEAAARNYLLQLMNGGTPNIPVAPTAGLSQDELRAIDMARSYAGSEVPGMSYLQSVVNGPSNILDIPEYKALADTVMQQGQMETNRVGRSLRLRGGSSSSTGANVLGQSVEEQQSKWMSALAPYASQERSQKMTAAEQLASLGESSMLNRLNALSSVGTLERQLQQLQQTAQYNQQMTKTMWPYQQGQQLASTILGNSAQQRVTQTPNALAVGLGTFGTLLGKANWNTTPTTTSTNAGTQYGSGWGYESQLG